MDKEDRGLLWLLMILAGILLATGVVTYQLRNQLTKVTTLRQEVAKNREAQEKYENLRDEFSRQRINEAEWKALLVADEESVAQFAQTIEAMAKERELVLTIQFDDLPGRVELAGKQGQGLKVELVLTGSYEAMVAFLDSLETSNYLVKQDKVQLSKQESGSYVLTLNGVLIMKQK